MSAPANVQAALDKCRSILKAECDPFAPTWNELQRQERQFWLGVSKAPKREIFALSLKSWADLPGDLRCVIKNNLYRCAKRAQELLGAADALKGYEGRAH